MWNKVNIYVYIFFFLSMVVFTSCGSKKKTVEVNKSTYRENKDLSVFQQKNELSVITFTKDASEMIIEPNMPDKPLIVGKDTIHNAKKVVYRKSRVDSTATNVKNEEVEARDKGEVYSSNETRNVNLEREDTSNNIKWSIWGIALILICVMVILFWGKLKVYYQNWKKRSSL